MPEPAQPPPPASALVSGRRHPYPFFVGQEIVGAAVVGVYPKDGAMLDLGGAKKWTNNWLREGTSLTVGDRVDVRVKSVDGPNRRVIVQFADAGVRPHGRGVGMRGSRKEERSAFQ